MNFELVAQLALGGVILGSSYALLGLSFSLIYSTTQIFHFAHAVVFTVVAYIAILFAVDLLLPLYIAIPAAIAVGIGVGMLIELWGYRPMRRAGATLMALFLISLGLATVAPNMLQIVFGPQNRSMALDSPKTFSMGFVTFTSWDIVTVVIAWILIAGVLVFLSRSRMGKAVAATRVNPVMAASVGIDISRIYLLVFAIGSGLVACAAVLTLLNGVASPTMGLAPILIGLVATFFGGVGNNLGGVVGGFVLGLLTSLSAIWLSSNFQTAVVFTILFVFIIVRPQGLIGRRRR